MVAVQEVTGTFSQRRPKDTYVRSAGLGTELSTSVEPRDYIVRKLDHLQTDPLSSEVRQPLVDTTSVEERPLVHEPFPASSVKGAVVQVLEHHVEIACRLDDQRLSLHLPKALVPAELQVYGTPVRLTMSDKDGNRTPLVERREPDRIERTEEEIAALAWLEEETK